MSDRPQPGVPFGFGQFDLGEVVRMLRSEGPLNFDVAHQVATWVALQGEEEPPVPGADAALMEELTRTAHIHVLEATGLGAELEVRSRTLGRAEWSTEVLDGLRPVLTTLAQRLTAAPSEADVEGGFGDEPGAPADLANLLTAMAPVLLGVQAGFMVGHLGSLALARYEMPLPLDLSPGVTFVAPNLSDFERDWELPPEEVRFYVALHEVLHAAMLSVPWVRERVLRLAGEYVGAFEVDPRVVEERFAGVDPNDPESLERAMGDPSELLGAMRSPAQEGVLARLTATTAVLEGYADHVLADAGRPLIPSFDRIREASHRHRVERGEAARFLEALLGFELSRNDYERAAAFCQGVAERAGAGALRRLFEREALLPTPPELDAAGLWLERINLPEEPSASAPLL